MITRGASGVKIEGNFIGTDPTGTQDQSNGFTGVFLGGSTFNVVGGAPRLPTTTSSPATARTVLPSAHRAVPTPC